MPENIPAAEKAALFNHMQSERLCEHHAKQTENWSLHTSTAGQDSFQEAGEA